MDPSVGWTISLSFFVFPLFFVYVFVFLAKTPTFRLDRNALNESDLGKGANNQNGMILNGF